MLRDVSRIRCYHREHPWKEQIRSLEKEVHPCSPMHDAEDLAFSVTIATDEAKNTPAVIRWRR